MQPSRAFRHAPFRRYQLGRFCAILGMQTLSVAVGWQVYAMTGRALDLGLVGLVQFLPQLLLFPITGMVADRLPRHRVLVAVNLLFAACALLLALATAAGASVGAIFAIVTLLAVGRAFSAPLGPSVVPLTVPAEDLVNALSWNSATWSVGSILGPALAGGVYALTASAPLTFAWGAFLLGVATILYSTLELRPQPLAPPSGAPLEMMTEGVRFIFRTPILLAAISLDLFAVLFGGAVALLPIYARDLLIGGPGTLGLLRAAPSVGAVLMAFWLTRHPIERRVGPTLLAVVTGFGLATLMFAYSTSVAMAAAALFFVGATDEVSVFIRQNIVQLSTPEHMRGRVSAAEFVFIGASNELGEMESGLLAEGIGPVRAAAFGGLASIVVVAVTAVVVPSLRRLDRYAEIRTVQKR